jgi:hypothetical protein
MESTFSVEPGYITDGAGSKFVKNLKRCFLRPIFCHFTKTAIESLTSDHGREFKQQCNGKKRELLHFPRIGRCDSAGFISDVATCV